jgi:hypothetical protein
VIPQIRPEVSLFVPPNRPAPGIYLYEGPRLVAAQFLSALCPALGLGLRIYWIDGSNGFDAHGASYAARVLGFSPKELLARVSVARPFNLYQLETMVCRKLPARWSGEPVVLSDPFGLFYDEDVPWAEARAVFSRTLAGLKRLPAVWLVLSSGRTPPAGREGLVELLGKA